MHLVLDDDTESYSVRACPCGALLPQDRTARRTVRSCSDCGRRTR